MISPSAAAQIRSLLDQLRAAIDQAVASPPPAPAAPRPPAAIGSAEIAARPKDASGFFADHGRFYDFLRGNRLLGPVITASEYQGCEAIIIAFASAGAPISYVAYGMATAYLETAHTMQPIKEIGSEAYFTRMYDIRGARPAKARELGNLNPGDGARFAGRGYVQLTGRSNYAKATAKLRALGFDVDLVATPDLAMRPDVAAAIMVHGMIEGWFTGRQLDDDLLEDGPSTHQHFTDSRDIINGRDKAAQIAGYAVDFQTGLLSAGYRPALGVKL